jgi:hypothetical protein
MPSPAIKYEAREGTLTVKGFGLLLTHGSGDFVAPVVVVEGLSLAELKAALLRWAEDYRERDARLQVSDDSPEHFGEDSLVRSTGIGLEAGKLVIQASAMSIERPPSQEELTAPLIPLLRRRRAAVTHVEVYETSGYWVVTVSVAWSPRGARVRDAIDFADDVEALLGAGLGGAITLPIALDLVRASRSELLIGMRESDWLEVKSAPYRLDEPTEQIELAKDVAAMANSGGGMILLGAKAKKLPEHEEIHAINRCRLADVSPRRYRDLIHRRVYPEVRGFDVELIPDGSAGTGVVLLYIPAQDEGQKPFIVHGALVGGKVRGAFVGIPRRVGDSTIFVEPQTLHARLRAGERALSDTGGTGVSELRAQVIEVRDTSVPAWLRTVIAAARHDGISVEHGRGSVAFSAPGRSTVVVSSDPQGPLVEELRRQTLVEQLVSLGLRTRRGPRGHLIPEFAG